jgi:hypothetical protein
MIDEQLKTFGCHHASKTCPLCEGMVDRWEKEQIMNTNYKLPEPTYKIYRGELCFKSDADDQSYGMWCPVNLSEAEGVTLHPESVVLAAYEAGKASRRPYNGRAMSVQEHEEICEKEIRCVAEYKDAQLAELEFSWAGCSQQLKDACKDLDETEKRLVEAQELIKKQQGQIEALIKVSESAQTDWSIKWEEDIEGRLIAAQAENEWLREALTDWDGTHFGAGCAIRKALATPTSHDHLREHDARLVERIAEYLVTKAHSNLINDVGLKVIANKIRKGEW